MEVPGFEILGRIGRGGMGEVFRAVRVGPGGFRKQVALKRLALDHSIDARMVQRFFAEARISARLDHENVVRVHDLLVVDDGHFIVLELLRGWNLAALRELLLAAGGVPWWVPCAIAEQALAGLAYAHALRGDDGAPLGLVHRDVTPRNVFLCAGGVVKVLDFGIAKLRHALTPALTRDAQLHGTIEFVAPEQARGEPADARTDLYQLAGSLYWALTGEYPHGTGTAAEIVARSLAGGVRRVDAVRADVPGELAELLAVALAQDRDARFRDAGEMRAALREVLGPGRCGAAALAGAVAELEAREDGVVDDVPAPTAAVRLLDPVAETVPAARLRRTERPRRRRAFAIAVVAVAALAIGAAGFLAGRALTRAGTAAPPEPDYRRVTFRRGMITAARFAPDARSFLYSAAWNGNESDVYLATIDNPEGRSLDLAGSELLAVSRTGELALVRDVALRFNFVRIGNMTITSQSGGVQRPRYAGVQAAEWAPDGSLALVRWEGATTRLEYPPGNVRFASDTEWISSPRISPDGRSLAFLRHGRRRSHGGRVALATDEGVRDLTPEHENVAGLVWRPDGREVWFGATERHRRDDTEADLYAVSLDGAQRVVTRAPSGLLPSDVDGTGRMLVTRISYEQSVSALAPGATSERDLSWFDYTWVTDIAADGQLVALSETGGAVGPEFGAYVRRIDGTGGMRIGSGITQAISPDKAWVLSVSPDFERLVAIPTGTGEQREVGRGTFHGATWIGNDRVFYCGLEAGRRACHVVDVARGTRARSVPADDTPVGWFHASPDGTTVAGHGLGDERAYLVSVPDGAGRPLGGALPGERPIQWSADGASLLVARFGEPSLTVTRITVATGAREVWRRIAAPDPAGVTQVIHLVVTPDAAGYAYSYQRRLATLYVAEGLR